MCNCSLRLGVQDISLFYTMPFFMVRFVEIVPNLLSITLHFAQDMLKYIKQEFEFWLKCNVCKSSYIVWVCRESNLS